MNWISILVAALAAACVYLASPHQTLWPAALRRARFLRWLAAPLVTGAAAAAVDEYGVWCGLSITLAGCMTTLVALPFADAWLRRRRARQDGKPGARHVG